MQKYKRVIQKSKVSISYDSGFDGKDFDLKINSSSLEPKSEKVMYLKVILFADEHSAENGMLGRKQAEIIR